MGVTRALFQASGKILVSNDRLKHIQKVIKKYLGNPNLYLFNCKIILCINITDDMVLLLIAKLHRIIWNIRCEVAKKVAVSMLIFLKCIKVILRNSV